MKKKILIFEDQYDQFKKIVEIVEELDLESLPKIDDEKSYNIFRSLFQSFLNGNLTQIRFSKFEELCDLSNIDLLFLDYYLDGDKKQNTCLKLLQELWKINKIRSKPYIIHTKFGRVEFNDLQIELLKRLQFQPKAILLKTHESNWISDNDHLDKIKEIISEIIRRQQLHIFFSYATSDQADAKKFVDEFNLKTNFPNYPSSIWSQNSLSVGQDWHQQIIDNIENANVFISFLSTPYFNSKYSINEELTRFKSLLQNYPNKIFFPVLYSNTNLGNLDEQAFYPLTSEIGNTIVGFNHGNFARFNYLNIIESNNNSVTTAYFKILQDDLTNQLKSKYE